MPAVVEAGRRIASERQTRNLEFTSDFSRAASADVLLCLGVLQFIEQPLAEQLVRLSELPPHVIVNGLPLHPTTSYVTLVNNAGAGVAPYRVLRRDEFIASVTALGYELVDHWRNPEKGCRIPLHPELDLDHYSGLYFRLPPG